MEVGKLTVNLRKETGKGVSRRLRANGLVPGVCYGVGLDGPVNITVDPKALKASLDPVKRDNTVINVVIEDEGKKANELTAMLWEYKVHPIRRVVTHVDLKAIDAEKEVEVEVPIELVGTAAGIVEGGQIHIERRSFSVRCRPADIPAKFVLDISSLDVGDALHISDLEIPANVTPAVSEKLTIVTCVAPRAEKAAAEGEIEVEAAAAAPAAEAKEEGEKK
jgi:large subunit ribosomal protein L25